MRKFLRSFVMMALLAVPFVTQAQLGETYLFSTGVDATKWVTLSSSATQLNLSGDDVVYSTLTPIGFSFTLDGQTYTNWTANTNGQIRLGDAAISSSYYSSPFSSTNMAYNTPKIVMLGCDGYMVSGVGYVKYELFGTDGNHTLVIEYKNSTYNSTTRDYPVTVQIHLNEADNSITYVFGEQPSVLPAVAYQMGVGVSSTSMMCFNTITNTIAATAPTTTTNAAGTWPEQYRYYAIAPNPNPCYNVVLGEPVITNNSVTLSWTDSHNTGVTYTVMNGSEVVATGLTEMTYTATGLTANTSYTFTVLTNCSTDNTSLGAVANVRTACDLMTLPYSTSFEDDPYYLYNVTPYADAVPYCWARINDATGTYNYYPYVYNSSSYAHSGTKLLYFYVNTTSTYANNEYMVMPQLDPTVYPMNNNMITFWARWSSNATSIEVGSMSDPTDASTFVADTTIALTSTYTQYMVKLNKNSLATNAYAAFHVSRSVGSSYRYVYLDDVTIDTIPACWPVTGVQIDSTTANSISLSWNANPENTGAVTYNIMNGTEVLLSGITATHVTVTGLTANTAYTLGVVAVNAQNKTSVPVEVSGRTDCDPNFTLTVPYTMGFEEENFDELACWTVQGNASWELAVGDYSSTTGAHSGSYNVRCPHTTSGNVTKLITPAINLTTLERPMLRFWHIQRSWGGDQDQLRVYYRQHADSAWTELAAFTEEITEWTLDSLLLPNPTATYQIAFEETDGYGYYVAIDDISIDNAPQYNVTLNIINVEGDNENWGTAVASVTNPYWNDSVTLTATPGEYKRTAAWFAGTVADTIGNTPLAVDTNIYMIRVTSDTTITVFFSYGQFRIAAVPNQPRMGSVEADPVSANYMYDYQLDVTLTAVPANGFMFKEWLNVDDNSVFGTENPLTLTAIQNYDLKARFVIDTFHVNYTAILLNDDNTFVVATEAGQYGTITGAENGLVFGEGANITAVPAEHYEWQHWATSTDNITPLTADQTISFRMLGDTTLYPVFTPEHYTVTIDGDGTRATYTGAGEYAYGDNVTISVSNVDPNYTWNGWWENGELVTMDNSYTFVIEGNRTFFANIPGGMNTVTFMVNDIDMGSVAVTGFDYFEVSGALTHHDTTGVLTLTLPYGSIIYATATPAPQFAQFNGWSNGNENPVASFNVVSDDTITANFGFQTYQVDVNVYPDALVGTVAVAPATPEYGESVTLTATAADHWVFDHWTDADGTTIGTDLTYTSGLLFEDVAYNAYFVRDTHTVVALVEDDTYGTTEVTNTDAEVAANFVHGSAATLAFTEGYGYTFAGWSNGTAIVSTDNPYTIDEVEEDITLTATVTPIDYTVTVVVAEGQSARGTVSTTTPTVAYLGTATITATPKYGYVFDSWTTEDGDAVELPLVITQDTTIVANFGYDQFTVTGAPHADCIMMGTVAPATQDIDYHSTATLTATANYGYHFTKWVDAAGNELGTTESIDIVVEGDSAVYAMFDYEQMDVTINVNDPLFGSAEVTSATAPYFFSQTLTIKAIAEEHYHFNEWIDGDGNTVSTENPYTFIVTGPVNYTAVFAIDTHTVTLVYNENAVTDIYGAGSYIYGSDVEIGLTEAYGFTFTGWDNGESANPLTVALVSDTVIEALFSTNQYTVTAEVEAASAGRGTVAGSATVDYMSTVILVATANYGYDFVNWTDAAGNELGTNTAIAIQALRDSTVYANFSIHKYDLTIASANETMGSVSFPDAGADPSLTVADGTTTNSYVPLYGTYMDDPFGTQSIYPASMLTTISGNKITSMHYYPNADANSAWGTGKTLRVWVKEVADADLSAGFISIDGATKVYDGTIAYTDVTLANGFTVNFSAPYTYNGGNLLVAFQVNEEDISGYRSLSFYGVSSTYGSYSASGSAAHNFTSTYSSNSRRSFLPKVTFTYQMAGDGPVSYEGNVAHVEYNNNVNVAAEANYGYHFTNWSNGETAAQFAVNVTSDSTLTANFAKNQYAITAQVGGDMAGTVAGSATVDYLETVTLTATPNADHRLLRWVNADDEILGTDLTLTVTAERDSVITAVFGYQVYTLTANTEDIEMGGVFVEDPNNLPEPITLNNGTSNNQYVPFYGLYADEDQHNQMIYPASGIQNMAGAQISKMVFYIDQDAYNGSNTAADYMGTWTVSLGETSATTLSSLDNTTSVTEVYDGYFDCSTGLLTLNFATPYTYNGGNLLVDIQHDAAGWNTWYFLGETVTGASYCYNNQRNFLPKVTFTYAFAGVVPSLATSHADVDYSTNVNVYATPAEHYHFVGWANAAGDTVLTNATETITVLGDSTLTALFDGDVMPMTYQVNSAVRGSVEGPANGEYNTEVTFEATAAHGYEFARWDDGDLANPRTVTVKGTDAENTYKAIFDFKQYRVHVEMENGTLANELQEYYYYGAQVSLTAEPAEHYTNWKGWKDADGNLVSTANPYTFIVVEDVDLIGYYEIDSVDYTFASNDVTMGTVTSDIAAGRYAYNTEANLTATAASADYHFVDWNDGEAAAERTVVLTQDTDLVANFALNQYNIATVAENGTAVWAGYDYAYPTVNITINGEDSYGDGWTSYYGGPSTLNIVQNGTTVYGFTLPSGTTSDSYSTTLTADSPITFEWVSGDYDDEASFTITVDGTVVISIADASTLTDGQVVFTIPTGTPAMTEVIAEGTTPVDPHTNLTFTATPAAGYNFVNWQTTSGTVISSANPLMNVEIVSDTTLVANFATDVYVVTAISTDEVMGSVSPATANGTVVDPVHLTATPSYGFVFVNWTDAAGTVVSTNAEFDLNVTSDTTVYAHFTFDWFNVAVQANNATYGTVALNGDNTVLSGSFPYGDTVNLSATAATGYYFVNWTDNTGATVSDQATCRFIVEADVTYTANFADGSEYTITAAADDPAHGQVTGAGTYMAGTTITLTAVEFPNYYFTEWSDGTTVNPYVLNVTQDSNLVAIYDTVAYTVTVNGVAESVKYGVSYTVIAADSACRTFNGWSNGTEVVASGNQYTFVVTGDITLTATYSEPVTVTEEVTMATCGAYTWNGVERTTSGDYTYSTTTAAGCDSTITLHLTVSDVLTSTDVQTSCGAYTWIDGITYTESNNTATYTTTASNGCDSVITLNLTVNNPAGVSTTASECGSYTWNGTAYTTSGTYNYSYTDNNGCTVVDTLVLTINQPTSEIVSASACGSYSWNGDTYTASGIYYDTLTNAAGCDSIVTLALTINQPVYTTINQTACGSYTWNGTEYTVSGNYSDTLTAANSCDSIVTLALTINAAATAAIDTAVCSSFNWNGTEYTTSGTYTINMTAANGCDSVITLTLTVNQPVAETVTETAESNLVWNGVTYTESGTYYWTGVAANGCDSVVTLILTITNPQSDTNYYTVTFVTVGNGTVSMSDTVVAENTILTVTATPAEHYTFSCWMVGNDTVGTMESYTFTVTADVNVTAVFTYVPRFVTIVGIVDSSYMGTILGTGDYQENSTLIVTAQAETGFRFVEWEDGTTAPSRMINLSDAAYAGMDTIYVTARFERVTLPNGIEEGDMENVTIYSTDSRIIVRGAEGKTVNVYDINGRTIDTKVNAAESVEFRMVATGVYLVKVGNAPAKRVLVVR